MSTAGLEDKFRSLIVPRYGAVTAERAIAAVHALPDSTDMALVFRDLIEK